MKRPNARSARLLAAALLGMTSATAEGQSSIHVWGNSAGALTNDLPDGPGFVDVSAGASHCVALRADGSLVSWGLDHFIQVSGTPSGTGFTHMAAGQNGSMALRADGSIASWGHNTWGQVTDTPSGTGFVQLAGGAGCRLALRADGSITAWGDNGAWLTDIPTDAGYVDVAAGNHHSLALRGDGSIRSWGIDNQAEVLDTPLGTGYSQLTAGSVHSVALHEDGSVDSWGWDIFTQGSPGGTGFTQVSGGANFCVALGDACNLRASDSLIVSAEIVPLVGGAPQMQDIGTIDVVAGGTNLLEATFTLEPALAYLDNCLDFRWVNVEASYTVDGEPQTEDPVVGVLPAIDPSPTDGPQPFYYTATEWANGTFGGTTIRAEGVFSKFSDSRSNAGLDSTIDFQTFLVVDAVA